MKKFVPALILLILGSVIITIGALFKIMHWPGADILLIGGTLLEVASGIMAIAVLLRNKNLA